MRAWVTDCPNFLSQRNIPLRFRFHSAMMGTLGIGGNILKWSNEDMKLAKDMVEEYKSIREIVQEGDFFRLENTSTNNYHLFEYTKDNEALLFAFLPQTQIGHRPVRVKLRNLDEKGMYEYKINGETMVKSGSYLMNYGVNIHLRGDYQSEIIRFDRR